MRIVENANSASIATLAIADVTTRRGGREVPVQSGERRFSATYRGVHATSRFRDGIEAAAIVAQ